MAESNGKKKRTAEQEAVEATGDRVAETQAAVTKAQMDLAAAHEEHAAAVQAAKPVPDPTKHILVDFSKNGEYGLYEQPEGWNRDYRLLFRGKNVEHVGDHVVTDADGKRVGEVWQYRAM